LGVSTNDGGVDHLDALFRERARKGLKQGLEDAGLSPPAEAAVDAVPAAIPLGHIDPARAGAYRPQDAVQDASVVVTGAADPTPFGWQERGDERPLRLTQFLARQRLAPAKSSLESRARPALNQFVQAA